MEIYHKLLSAIIDYFFTPFFTDFFFFLALPSLIQASALDIDKPYLSCPLESVCMGRILAASFSLVVTSSCTASLSWVRRKEFRVVPGVE